MTDPGPTKPAASDSDPAPIVTAAASRRRLSLIWLIPMVAAVIALWLGYKTLTERGPTITITFRSADGLESGKTRIMHKNVELGVVERVELSPDLSHVVVTARMQKWAEPELTTGTHFWVVRPRLSAAGVSGLETLVSGSYIELDPGKGEAAYEFTGLEEPPVVRADVPGREFLLTTSKLGNIGPGSPVFFRGLKVGEVLGYKMGGIDAPLVVHVFVNAPYDRYVYDGSHFWNASGISLKAGATGFKLQVESLQAVLAGGIVFETPARARAGQPSQEDHLFTLYDDLDSVQEAGYTSKAVYQIHFEGSVHGLEAGAPVELRGIQIGRVIDVHVEFDAHDYSLRVPVTVELDTQRIRLVDTAPNSEEGQHILDQLVQRGLRAQLRSASLITGQLMVALDFFPDAPAATIRRQGPHPELPSVPSAFENIMHSVNQLLERMASLPLDQVVTDLRATLQGMQRIVNAPELLQSLKSLNDTLAATRQLAGNTSAQMGPLLASLRQTASAAEAAFKQAGLTMASANDGFGQGSKFHHDLDDLLAQLKDTARSIRLLADYLEQHPEALVRGKADQGAQ
jgi:paraquat-inducible protein B